MPSVRATLSVSLLLLAGCRARQTGPDENYEKGSRIYQQLYATQLDDAYGDPKMKEAEGLLKKVDPRSIDSESAKRMLASIDSGRALLAKQRVARNQMAAAAAATIASQPQLDPVKIIAASTPDAGVVDPFGPGASIADINATSGGCLTAGEPYREQVTGATGTVYRVGKSPQCAERLPGFVGEAVLVSDGKIYRRLPDPTPTKGPTPLAAPDAGTAAPAANADAGPAKAAAKPKPPVQSATDGSPDSGESQLYIPGMPIPDGLAPPPPPPDPQQQ